MEFLKARGSVDWHLTRSFIFTSYTATMSVRLIFIKTKKFALDPPFTTVDSGHTQTQNATLPCRVEEHVWLSLLNRVRSDCVQIF